MADDRTDDGPRWREDFPIRWDDDRYVTRRELAKFLTLGSGLLAGTSVMMALVGPSAGARELPARAIPGAAAVAPGASLLFRYPTDTDPCILVRDRAGGFQAFSQVCTHLACAVVHEPGSATLACPCHKGFFAAADGRPIAGPPTRRLPRIRLETRGGELFAIGVEV